MSNATDHHRSPGRLGEYSNLKACITRIRLDAANTDHRRGRHAAGA